MIELALVLVLVRRLDGHPTADDLAIEKLELVHMLLDGSFDGWRRIHVSELQLQG